MRFEALDWPFEVLCDAAPTGAVIAEILGDLRASNEVGVRRDCQFVLTPRQDGSVSFLQGPIERSVEESAGRAMNTLISFANVVALTESPERLLIHAGAVAVDDEAVLFVGASGAGKSSLTVEALTLGASYLSDETVWFDRHSGQVRGYHKPLTLKAGRHEARPDLDPRRFGVPEDHIAAAWHVPTSWGGWHVERRAISPRMIVFPRRAADAGHRPELRAVTPGRAAVGVGEQVSYLRRLEDPLGQLKDLVEAVPAFELHYSEAPAAAALVLEELA